MRSLSRIALVALLVAVPAIGSAQTTPAPPQPNSQAVPLKALVDLQHSGVSDDVLIALLDSTSTVYQLNAADVRGLRDAGFSDKLIITILNTTTRARLDHEQQLAAVQELWAQQAQQPVNAIDANDPTTQTAPPIWNTPVTNPVVFAPVYAAPTLPYASGIVASPIAVSRRRSATPVYVPVPVYVTIPTARPISAQPAPVYWGFGGKLRPDAWKEPGKGGQ